MKPSCGWASKLEKDHGIASIFITAKNGFAESQPRQTNHLDRRGSRDYCRISIFDQQGIDPRAQFVKSEGLYDVVVGAGVQPLHLVFPMIASGQDKNRKIAAVAP